MDITSSIAAASVNMSMAKFQQDVSVAMTAKVLDVQEVAADNLIEMLSQPMPIPSFGHKLDIKV